MTAQLTQPPQTTVQRIILQGTWEQFKLVQQASENFPAVRLAFYEETIEIFTPQLLGQSA